MKSIMLAGVALAFAAAPVMAQQTPMASPPPPAADAAAPAGAVSDANAPTPVGGFQPTTPPLSGTPVAGQPIIVQPSVSPNQAFPPPAPLAEYPICKKGQYDKCRQRGG